MSLDLLYRVCPAAPQAHRFHVDIEIPNSSAEIVELSLPAWIPGSYMIRDFARNILTLVAESVDGTPLECRKRDKQTWVCRTAGHAIRVHYQALPELRESTKAFKNRTLQLSLPNTPAENIAGRATP